MTLLSPGIEIKEKDLSAYISRAATGRAGTVGKFQWGPCFDLTQVTDESDVVNTLGLPNEYTAPSFFSVTNFLKYANDCRVVRVVNPDIAKNASAEYQPSVAVVAPGTDYVVGDLVHLTYLEIPFVRVGTQLQIHFGHSCTGSNGPEIFVTGISAVAGGILADASYPITFVQPDAATDQYFTIACADSGATSGTIDIYWPADPIASVTEVDSGGITEVTPNMSGINLIVTCNRIPEYSAVAPRVDIISVAGADGEVSFGLTQNSTVYFGKDSDSDEAMLAHAPVMSNLNLPTLYAKYPGAYGNDISVDIVSYADFSNLNKVHIPVVLQEAYLTPTQAVINRGVFGINGPQKEGQWAITVYYKGEIVETFVGSTIRGDRDIYGRTIYISDLFAAGVSKYIMAACGEEGFWPDHSMQITFTGGVDSGATAGDWIQAWDLFSDPDTLYVNLLFAGGACNESEEDSLLIQQYISQSVAEVRRDCLAFLSPSIVTTTRLAAADAVENAVQYRSDLAINSSFAESDSGQHKWQFDKYNDRKWWIANNADIAGLCAFTDRVAAPWNSPAGLNRGIIKGVIKLAYDAKKSLRDTLYEAQLNPIVFFPAEGYCLFGDKTLQGKPSAFDRINVRRLFNLLEKAIGDASKYKLFENNTAFTRRSFVTQVSTYLDTIKAQGGVIEYYVWCDERNNTAAVIDRNEFVGTIFIKPPRSINYITLNFVATASGANFEELIASQF